MLIVTLWRRWRRNVGISKHVREPPVLQNRFGEFLVYVRSDQMLKRIVEFAKFDPTPTGSPLR
jgi:hypothetical protein